MRVLVLFLCRRRGRSNRGIAECCRVLKWTCQWVASVDRLEGRDVPDCELQVELRAPHAFAHVVFDVLKFWKRGCIRCTVWCGAHDRFKGVVGNPLEEIRVNSSRRYKVMNSVHCLRPFVVHVLQCSIETDGSHYEVVVMGAAGSGEPTPTMWPRSTLECRPAVAKLINIDVDSLRLRRHRSGTKAPATVLHRCGGLA